MDVMNLPVRRTRENAVLTGVCAGLARRWGVDANLLRIALIILSFATGLGLVLYGVGYLVLPADDTTPSPVRRALPFTRDWPMPALVITLTAVGFLAFGLLGGWSGIGVLPVLVALGIWYAASRRQAGRPAISPDPTPFERAAEAWRIRLIEHQANSGAALSTFSPAPLPSPAPAIDAPAELVRRRPRNRLWWLALALMAIGCTVVGATPMLGGYYLAGLDYLAVILISLGITLLIATWRGRPRLMGLATVLVMIATLITWGAQSTSPDFRIAAETRPFASATELPSTLTATVGELDLDFSELTLTQDTTIEVGLGAGDIAVRLPDTVNAVVTWDVSVGAVSLPTGEDHAGTSLTGTMENTVAADAPTLTIAVTLRAGSLGVTS